MANEIILGDGVFYIGTTAIALTRGGGAFSVEREYRPIEADGDYGPVKGRIRKIKSVATLKLNALTLLEDNLPSLYPATDLTSRVLTGKPDVEDADYQTEVSWVGAMLNGDSVAIELYNAINLENLEWDLVDKEEVVPEITYTAAYDPDTRTTEPWQITFDTPS